MVRSKLNQSSDNLESEHSQKKISEFSPVITELQNNSLEMKLEISKYGLIVLENKSKIEKLGAAGEKAIKEVRCPANLRLTL